MKRVIPPMVLAAAFAAPCTAVFAAPAPPRPAQEAEPMGAKYQVTIEGMMCGECQKSVKAALEKIYGVAKVQVDWTLGTADVTLATADGVLTLDQVKAALADLKDFTVKEVKKV